MRVFLIILMLLSFGLTRIAFAMPVMTAEMSMSDMSAAMHVEPAMHHSMASMSDIAGHDMADMAKDQHDAHKSTVSHGICAMCFPAIASVLPSARLLIGDRFALPAHGSPLLASAPEPLSPPPRQV